MAYTVAPAEKKEAAEIVVLLEEVDRFYSVSEFPSVDTRIQQVEAALFGNPPWAHTLLARDEGQLIGLATYSFLWPASDLQRSLYLKELYVTERYRFKGVGSLLMRHLVETARESDCSRVEWTTDTDNPEAQKFYERLGFTRLSSKIFYRLSDISTGQDAS